MFETSVGQARVAPQRRYGWLSVSLLVHSLVVIAVIAAGLSSTSLPKSPPREFQIFFRPAAIPQPPPAPHVATAQPAQQHAAAATVPHAATAPATLVTPLVIPNTIPNVQASANDSNLTNGNPSSNSDTNVIGDLNSVDIGPSSSSTTAVPDTVFHPGAEVKPAVVIQRVD